MSKYVERVLLVFNPNGSLKGAAQYPLTVDDTGAFPPNQGDAEAVDAKALAEVFGDSAKLMADLASLQEQLKVITVERDSLLLEKQTREQEP